LHFIEFPPKDHRFAEAEKSVDNFLDLWHSMKALLGTVLKMEKQRLVHLKLNSIISSFLLSEQGQQELKQRKNILSS
jgi:hypothetical protein